MGHVSNGPGLTFRDSYIRELVFLRNGLRPEMLLDRNRVVSPALDRAIVGDNHAGDTLDDTNTSHNTACRHLSLGVQLVAG